MNIIYILDRKNKGERKRKQWMCGAPCLGTDCVLCVLCVFSAFFACSAFSAFCVMQEVNSLSPPLPSPHLPSPSTPCHFSPSPLSSPSPFLLLLPCVNAKIELVVANPLSHPLSSPSSLLPSFPSSISFVIYFFVPFLSFYF